MINRYRVRPMPIKRGTSPFSLLTDQPTLSVLGILIPALLLALAFSTFSLLHKLQQVGSGWDYAPKIMLFLKTSVNDAQAEQLLSQIKSEDEVVKATYVSSQQALDQLNQQAQSAGFLTQLPGNTLPGVIEILPKRSDKLERLVSMAQSLPTVSSVQFDEDSFKRQNVLLNFSHRAAYLFGGLLAMSAFFCLSITLQCLYLNGEARAAKTHHFFTASLWLIVAVIGMGTVFTKLLLSGMLSLRFIGL